MLIEKSMEMMMRLVRARDGKKHSFEQVADTKFWQLSIEILAGFFGTRRKWLRGSSTEFCKQKE